MLPELLGGLIKSTSTEHPRKTGQTCLIGMITWFVVLLVTRTAEHMIVSERQE